MKIKAISLWQPWASLVAVGAKTYETRSWKTNYRGPLLICAARKFPPFAGFNLDMIPGARRSLAPDGGPIMLPRGAAVAVCHLVECHAAEMVILDPYGLERHFGDFSPGRWAWKLENIRAIEPFAVKGTGLFEVEAPFLTPPWSWESPRVAR